MSDTTIDLASAAASLPQEGQPIEAPGTVTTTLIGATASVYDEGFIAAQQKLGAVTGAAVTVVNNWPEIVRKLCPYLPEGHMINWDDLETLRTALRSAGR